MAEDVFHYIIISLETIETFIYQCVDVAQMIRILPSYKNIILQEKTKLYIKQPTLTKTCQQGIVQKVIDLRNRSFPNNGISIYNRRRYNTLKCDEPELDLNIRHSYCTTQSPKELAVTSRRSDNDVGHRFCLNSEDCGRMHPNILNKKLSEYYKKYEHDEEPVKDLPATSTKVNREKSLTNSELDKLETQIFKSMSQEIKSNNSSMTLSVESNIKFFKTKVQEIFDIFYGSMRDFDLYKKRFNDILAKNQAEAVADMEDFINDMIQHIMASDSSISTDIKHYNNINTSVKSMETKECCTITSDPEEAVITPTSTSTNSAAGDPQPVFGAYKNDDYITDSTFDNKVSKIKTPQEEVYNIYLVSGSPFVQIKMNDRHLLSEINIKKPSQFFESGKYVASAENIRKLAAKKMELEKYVEHGSSDDEGPEREIPVKVSFARKNIHLDEDFTREPEPEKSLMSKICSFLCKKFRKNV